tara:strand:- start:23873 stop:25138 length:1266 start_codon:yes stop_codon:yes gene_type:complete
MSKKIKVLTLGDHPLSPSGVGTQTNYICQALLKTGKFTVLSLGGAIKHQDYRPVLVEGFGEDWKVVPVDGYGSPELIRSVLRNEKPDIVWMMTDPRFWGWLWAMENEVRALCPLVYYHVWDNYPYPKFNKRFYDSNDYILSISKLTDDIVKNVSPDVKSAYLPHAVDGQMFAPVTPEMKKELRENNLEAIDQDKFIVFWNNRNARRKQSGSLIWWWKTWLDANDMHEKAQLIMHTDPKDVHGQDLTHIADHLGLVNRQVLFSTNKAPINMMPTFYQMADITINVSDAEGFGLATLESLSCGTPIIATMTGGLQEQVVGEGETFGVPLFPVSKSIIGSQEVPYIYEDRISEEQVHAALTKMYELGPEGRRELGLKGREHVIKNYNFDDFNSSWVDFMEKVHEECGSWNTRKKYNGITFKEIA